MIAEDLHGWLSIRVVSRLESDVNNSYFIEEGFDEVFQLRKSKTLTNNKTFYLMELSQMC